MDCKAFAARHAAYIDDTLPGIEMVAMREHLSTCTRCSRRDADVRRALLLVKNLPAIKVSAGFDERLRARIAAESAAPPPQGRNVSGSGTIRWAAAAVLLFALIGIQRWDNGSPAPARLPAVIASVPPEPSEADDESAPAYVASMSTGIPMWPALMLAEEGPLRFAATGLQNAALDASRPND